MIQYLNKDKIKYISLLTVMQAQKLPKNLLKYKNFEGTDYELSWWLYPIAHTMTHNLDDYYKIPFVDDFGKIQLAELGKDIYPSAMGCLRPALRLKSDAGCEINKLYSCGGVIWICISSDQLLYYDDADNFPAVSILPNPTNDRIEQFNENPNDRFEMSGIKNDLDEFWFYADDAYKYVIFYDDDTKYESDDISECLNKIYDGLESGKYSKINLINTVNKKQKSFTINDLEEL